MNRVFLFAVLSLRCFAAIATTGVWEVRPSTGSDTNGGGFDPAVSVPGTDFSQQGAAQISFTDLVIGGTTTQFASVVNPVGATFPGNFIKITGGAGCTVGWYEILSNATTTATVDRSMGTAASICTAKLGGAIATLAQLNTNMSLDQQAWAKAEATLVMGRINWAVSGGTGFAAVSGYTTTRGDGGYFTAQMNADDFFWVMNTGGFNVTFKNFILDKNNHSGGDVFLTQGCCVSMYNIKIINASGQTGFNFANGHRSLCSFCYVTGVSGAKNAFNLDGGIVCFVCVAYSNTLTSAVFNLSISGGGSAGGTCIRCIAANNTSSSAGFSVGGDAAPVYLINPVAVNNGGPGLSIFEHEFPVVVVNGIWVSNATYGISSNATMPDGANVILNNAFFGNGTAARNKINARAGDVTLTGNPFTNSASNDFSLNNTAGRGAALRAAGTPGALAIGGTGYLDFGVLQHQDPVTASGITRGVIIQ